MGKTILQRICIAVVLIILTSFTTSTEAIAGGEPAKLGEFPHLVQLSYSITGDLLCGGSILAENVILTAAHCVKIPHPIFGHSTMIPSNLIRVTAGSLEYRQKPNGTEREGEDWQRRDVSYYVLHPDFDLHQGTNDIALLFLNKPLNFSETVRPIQLPSASNQTYLRGTFAGWGQTGSSTKYSDQLKKLNIVFGATKSCVAEFSRAFGAFRLTDKHICSKFPRGVALCKGDSGSSLVCEEKRFHSGTICVNGPSSFSVICGVLSWATIPGYCGRNKSVAAFTDVSKYLDWIYKTTEGNGFFITRTGLGSSEEGFPGCGTGHHLIPNFHWFIFVFIAILVNSFA